jgi:hypothetical protein
VLSCRRGFTPSRISGAIHTEKIEPGIIRCSETSYEARGKKCAVLREQALPDAVNNDGFAFDEERQLWNEALIEVRPRIMKLRFSALRCGKMGLGSSWRPPVCSREVWKDPID